MVGGRLHEPVDEEALVVDHCGPGWRTMIQNLIVTLTLMLVLIFILVLFILIGGNYDVIWAFHLPLGSSLNHNPNPDPCFHPHW